MQNSTKRYYKITHIHSALGYALLLCFLTLTKTLASPKENLTPAAVPVTHYTSIAPTKLWDLLHTQLEIKIDWDKQQLNGLATLHLKPHCYLQNELTIDAKNLIIHQIDLIVDEEKKKLSYHQNTQATTIILDRTYNKEDIITLSIQYSTQPQKQLYTPPKLGNKQGIYFINGTNNNQRSKQVWTQSEPNCASYWFPTLDNPNQRCTQETYITIEDRYKTISNGTLMYSTLNDDKTRTDCWRLDVPHAPYLFMVTIGEFADVQDEWNDLPLTYYVERAYEPYASTIFEHTPEMLSFFSEIFDYPYPWPSYKQIVVKDYFAGAMENTTAVVFAEKNQGDARTLLDNFERNEVIAHEMAHHWFGNLVTCESWEQLVLNEALATWSSHLWYEYKYGPFERDNLIRQSMEKYLEEAKNKQLSLIRTHIDSPIDMFDHHTYHKGALIFHMLKTYLGQQTFLESLSEYLKKYAFSHADIHQLQKCFEETSGQNLGWFFNQWFFSPGHPLLKLEHEYTKNKLTIKIWQKKNAASRLYQLPLALDIWIGKQKQTQHILVNQAYQEFTFSIENQPTAICLDRNYLLVGEIEQSLTWQTSLALYKYSNDFFSKLQAINFIKTCKKDLAYYNFFYEVLSDSSHQTFQLAALEVFKNYSFGNSKELVGLEKTVINLTQAPNSTVRKKALETLSSWKQEPQYVQAYESSLQDPSCEVTAAALKAYAKSPHIKASQKVGTLLGFEKENYTPIALQLAQYYIETKKIGKYNWLKEKTIQLCHQPGGEKLLLYLAHYSLSFTNRQQQDQAYVLIQTIQKDNRTSAAISKTATEALTLLRSKKNGTHSGV